MMRWEYTKNGQSFMAEWTGEALTTNDRLLEMTVRALVDTKEMVRCSYLGNFKRASLLAEENAWGTINTAVLEQADRGSILAPEPLTTGEEGMETPTIEEMVKAKFATRSEAARYAAEQRWKGHVKEETISLDAIRARAAELRAIGERLSKYPNPVDIEHYVTFDPNKPLRTVQAKDYGSVKGELYVKVVLPKNAMKDSGIKEVIVPSAEVMEYERQLNEFGAQVLAYAESHAESIEQSDTEKNIDAKLADATRKLDGFETGARKTDANVEKAYLALQAKIKEGASPQVIQMHQDAYMTALKGNRDYREQLSLVEAYQNGKLKARENRVFQVLTQIVEQVRGRGIPRSGLHPLSKVEKAFYEHVGLAMPADWAKSIDAYSSEIGHGLVLHDTTKSNGGGSFSARFFSIYTDGSAATNLHEYVHAVNAVTPHMQAVDAAVLARRVWGRNGAGTGALQVVPKDASMQDKLLSGQRERIVAGWTAQMLRGGPQWVHVDDEFFRDEFVYGYSGRVYSHPTKGQIAATETLTTGMNMLMGQLDPMTTTVLDRDLMSTVVGVMLGA